MDHRAAAVLLAGAVLAACAPPQVEPTWQVAGGRAEAAPAAIAKYGCGACHTIPGIDGADAMVGPPLIGWSRRVYVAGMLPNTPEGLVAWIRAPQAVVPGNAMPDMGVTEQEARDIAAYLYTLR